MMNRIFACDFETTVYEGQQNTEVWSGALAELFSDNKRIFKSIGDFFNYFFDLNENVTLYFHNLKFDGIFILDYLLNNQYFTEAINKIDNDNADTWKFLLDSKMPPHSFKYSISDTGLFYTITIKYNKKYIRICDSLKLLPFSLAEIGSSFKTEHRKLKMKYEGYRFSGCEITAKEKEYIINDVLVLKEALEIMITRGYNKLTIGSCCMAEFKKIFCDKYLMDSREYSNIFVNLHDIKISQKTFNCNNADYFIRKSYKGGWCYLNPKRALKLIENGLTADVNSLYPSVMHSCSGNLYPYGKPIFWEGDFIPKDALKEKRYFFIRIKTRFYLKDGYLPTIQIKDNPIYKGNEWLKTSDYYNVKSDTYSKCYYDRNKNLIQAIPTLTLTMTDFELLKNHYKLEDTVIIGGCYFMAEKGFFDNYIDKYKEIKVKSKGAERCLAKLLLNNLYGKFATGDDDSFKVAYLKSDESIGFITCNSNTKKTVNIAVGSAVTSYARYFTITHAQKNYEHFIYSDTDSLHLDCGVNDLVDINIHPTDFNSWKIESQWNEGWFIRQKTYIEHITHEDLEKIDSPYYKITCAGLPQNCKNLMIMSIENYNERTEKINENYNFTIEDIQELDENEKRFINNKRIITDFKLGIIIPSKLKPHRIKGGVILIKEDYQMR